MKPTPTLLRLVLPFTLILAATAALAASAVHAAGDPFALPGHERVRIRLESPDELRALHALGFRAEEVGRERDRVELLVDEAGRQRLIALGYRPEPITFVTPPGKRTITSFAGLSADLALLAATYPDLTELHDYGLSVQGREIWALKVSANAATEEVEPEVRVAGAHHGNEKMSVQMNVRMAHYLLENYGIDPTVSALVDGLEIWFIPMMNPDGFEANSRYNAHGVDVNRNYGYMFEPNGSHGPESFSEPETRAIHEHAVDNNLSLSLSFHTQGDIVNSVWNYTPNYTEDDDVVWTLTTGYAAFNGYWAVRGWYWYQTRGDCNDWSYGARGDIDWTIETDDFDEENVWNQNRDAMLYLMAAASWGIHGQVTDALTGDPLRATVWVGGRGWPAFTDPIAGDYHKVLLAGAYTLRFEANGYETSVVENVVVPPEGGVTVDVALEPGGAYFADRIEQANIADPYDTFENVTLTMAMLAAPDDVGAALGKAGSAVVDMGPAAAILDGPGADVRVHESPEDGLTDGYRLYGGPSFIGPWTLIGDGAGTTAFDLAGTGLDGVRYLRLVDDGDGAHQGPYPGVEIDAIASLHAGSTTGIALAEPNAPATPRLALAMPAPNPVRAGGEQEIVFTLPAAGPVSLKLYDVHGRLLRTLAGDTPLDPAPLEHRLRWQARDPAGRALPSGVYLLRLATPESATARKILVAP